MNTCKICKKHTESDSNHIVDFSYFKLSHAPLESHILGYVYIEPKRHVEHWSEFTENESSELTKIIKYTEQVLKQQLNVERVYLITISEAVRHIHFHVIPRLSDQKLKGLDLIEQATQQIIKSDLRITTDQISKFITTSRDLFQSLLR